jgi:4-nitrophenyl phosphatase
MSSWRGKLSKAFEGISGVILDMDGVIYVGDRPVEGTIEAVKRIKEMGARVVFSTNNSAQSRAELVKKLAGMGIVADESEIVTSGYVTSLHLKMHSPKARVYIIGERGLQRELELSGIEVLPYRRAESATHVVVGLDRKLSYDKIDAGLQALLAGADFIATNLDPAYPTEKGLSPGAGAAIGALVGCSKREPSLVMGKPAPTMIKLALKVLGTKPNNTAIVGDRLDTDIAIGKKLRLRTVLVLSGVSTLADVKKVRGTKMSPDFTYKNLAEVVGCPQ